MSARMLLGIALVTLSVSCGALVGASPTPAVALSTAELKYRVMDAGGRIEFCDPDFYPVARADESALAQQRIADIQKDAETYAAITKRVGSDALAVYRDWKALNALELGPASFGGPAVPQTRGFKYRAQRATPTTPPARSAGTIVEGNVDFFGKVTITKLSDAGPLNCPICLARGTRIATPSGDVTVEDLRAGDVVWTLDDTGRRVAAPLIAIGSIAVPATHEVVDLVLADGRAIDVSPGHPTADGRHVGDLRAGDELDGARVVSAERVRYAGGFTFDVLPAGSTGAYWANGVLLGSTLR